MAGKMTSSLLLLPVLGLSIRLLLLCIARVAPNVVAALPWYPGRCKVRFVCSDESLSLETNKGTRRLLTDVVKDVTPPCTLNPLLVNGHFQTLWTAVKYEGPAINYKRRVFEAEDAAFKGHFAVDFVVATPKMDLDKMKEPLLSDPVGVGHTELPPRTTYFTDAEFADLPATDAKPLLITLHGLSGGSHEVYVRHVLEHLVKATPAGKTAGGVSGGGWEALVINSRGCAGSVLTSSLLYNARATWDIRQIVKWCRKTWPNRPLFAIGYSIGANILTNYLGEEGANCLLSAAVVISNPWNLDIAAAGLLRSTLGRRVYSKVMARQMYSLYGVHKEHFARNRELMRRVASNTGPEPEMLHKFDRTVQCAIWGYPSEGAYYRDASCTDAIFAVQVPLFAIHSIDDPIAIDEGVPYEGIKQNPYIVMCATNGGGHLGWFEAGGRWYRKPAVGFLNTMASDIDWNFADRPTYGERTPGGPAPPFIYSPMRRKACNAGEEYEATRTPYP